MTLHYNLSIDNITDGFLEAIREQYPHATLDIRVKPPKLVVGLTEKAFWDIIALFNWSDPENDATVIEQGIQVLAEKPVRQIYEFQDMLSAKLYALDTHQHAENAGENAWQGKDADFSVDEFLYARCCCVANGKTFYETVLKQPELMPKNLTFEALLTLAHKAYNRKTGKQFRYVPSYNIETFSNKKGWS